MANPKIEVEIVAKVEGLNSGVTAATNELDKLGKASQKTSSQVNQFRLSAGAAGSSAIAFNRVIQDAPFGIIGVGNNIQQLAEQLAFLRTQTGSTGSALGIFFKSLFTGTNLLVLGISAATSAFTAYKLGLFDTNKETKETITETEKLNQSLNSITKNLNSVDAARSKGNKGAAEEITKLELLNNVLTDLNKPYSERVAAFELIKNAYGSQLGNMTKEKALAEGIGDAYIRIVSAINQRAAAEAIFEKIVELKKQELDILEKEKIEVSLQNQALKERERIFGEIAKRGVEINKNGRTLAEIFGDQTVDFALIDLGKSLIAVNDEYLTLGNNVAPATQKALENNANSVKTLSNEFQSLANGINVFEDKSKKSGETLKRTFEDLSALNIDMILDRASLERLDEFSKQAEATFSSIRSGAADTRGIYTQNIDAIKQKNLEFEESLQAIGLTSSQVFRAIANGASEGFDSLADFVMKLAETQQVFNEAINIIEEGIENTIGDVAFAIGESLGEGGNVLKAAGSALLGGLAVVLNQLGQLAIATGIAIAGIKESLKTLNPAVAIGAGIALIALAGFVSSKARSLGNSRGGGGGSGVGGGSAAQGTSFVGGGAGGMFDVNRNISGEFVVRGTDLVYVLGQANNKINKG
jgi:hypothetical protein